MVNRNHFVTASEIGAQLKETNPDLEVSERTVQRELSRLGPCLDVSLFSLKAPRRFGSNGHMTTAIITGRKLYFLMKLHCRCSGILVWHGSVLVNLLHRWLNIRLSFICGVQFRPAEKLGCTYLLKIWTAIYISKSYIPMQTMHTDVSAGSFNMIAHLKRCS